MIELTDSERKIILFAKGHLKKEYPFKLNEIETFKPLYTKIYGFKVEEDISYEEYLEALFHILFNIYLRIKENDYTFINSLFSLFMAAFKKDWWFLDFELPIERVISKLFGLISLNAVIVNGEKRYDLED